MTTTDRIALGSAIATFLGVFVSIIALFLQMRKLSNQLMLQQFSDYTKRYQEVILNFPEDVNEKEFIIAGRDDYNHTMRYMRAYFDLCYEEWYLKERKLIDKKIWQGWKAGMQTAFSKPAFQQAWSIIKKDTKFGEKFECFVDELIKSSKKMGLGPNI